MSCHSCTSTTECISLNATFGLPPTVNEILNIPARYQIVHTAHCTRCLRVLKVKWSTVSPNRVNKAFCRVLDPGCSGHWQSGMLNRPCSFSQCWRTADSIAWRNVYPLDLMSGILMRFIGAERAMPPLTPPPRLKFELQSYCSCLLTHHTSLCPHLCLSVSLSQTLNAPHF